MLHLKSLCTIYLIAGLIRYGLINSGFKKEIENRVEVSTPVNSFARVVESVYREDIGVNPYSSDLLHETPFHLYCYKFILKNFTNYVDLIFILVDLLAAHFLFMFAAQYMFDLYKDQVRNKQNYAASPTNLLIRGREFFSSPLAVAMIYLFNPYSIINCVGYSTTVFVNLMLSIFFASLSYENVVFSILSLAVCVGQSFYFLPLLSPVFLLFKNKQSKKFGFIVSLAFFVTLFAFLYICKLIKGDWDFLESTYGFIWSVNDQQPNIGVFWYFFMEMFEHFRSLFIFSYQINVLLLYFIPLSIKYRDDPILLATCLTSIIAIFKSYPSVGDIAFVFGILPCWKHLYSCMQQVFISAVTIIVTTALAPILWDLWIYWGSANANFYFGTTLAFITAQIFLLTDIAFAYTKRKYLLLNGNNKYLNGKPAKLVLQ